MRKRFRYIVFLITTILCFNTLVYADTSTNEPSIGATTAILVEASTEKVLYEKDSNKLMYPASMTKLLTAIIAMEHFNPDDVIVVGREVNEISLDSSKAGHKKNESITVENLIRGLIIPSGNDTAMVIASAVSKKLSGDENLTPAQCEKYFANLMNQKAEELGCKNSNFTNPHGYHDENHYSTAQDMAKIAQEALRIDLIKKICGEKNYSGNGMETIDNTGLEIREYNWTSHNLLITAGEYSYPYATGLKTGYTNEAGSCVAASAQKDGVELIAIIFNSPDPGRWIDTIALFEYGFENFGFVQLGNKDQIVSEIGLHNHKMEQGSTLSLIIKEDINLFLSNIDANNLKTEINITNEDYIFESKDEDNSEIKITAPIQSDVKLGTIKYKSGETVLAEVDIYSGRDVEAATFFEKIIYSLKQFFSKLFTSKGIIAFVIIIIVIIVLILLIRMIINRRRRPKNKYKFKRTRRRF